MSAEGPRSRQELVIPPRGSHLPVVLGAVVAAGLGFGIVWAIGLGRTVPPPAGVVGPDGAAAVDAAPPANAPPIVAAEQDESHDLPTAAVRPWPAATGSAWGGGPTAAAEPETGVQPASYAEPGRFLPVEETSRPLSRFSHRPVGPLEPAQATEAAAEAADASAGAPEREDPAGSGGPASEPDAFPSGGVDEPTAAAAAPVNEPAIRDGEHSDVAEGAALETAAAMPEGAAAASPVDPFATAAAVEPAPLGAGAETSAGDGPAADDPQAIDPPTLAADPGVPNAVPVSDPFPTAEPAPAVPPAPLDAGLAVAEPVPAPVPPATPPPPQVTEPADPVADRAAVAAPPAAPAARFAGGGSAAFAAAPPLMAGPPAEPPALPPVAPFAAPPPGMVPPSAAADPAAGAGEKGQGRPGPPQLEGLQSPHLALEKRGPREIQVGKPARYEILVRNVGSAVAHDVTVTDAIPYGTTLVTTTPPASPGAAPDALVWRLGTLPPGGQGRLVVEVMPQIEGEIGSLASISFRADATARSRATKPALALDCTQPDAVRIGRDATVTLTVSNPGSGTATGVVVEGSLPENVSHRSGRELEFDVGQLRPGESRSIELVLGSTGPGVQEARLTARADGGIEVERSVRLEVTAPTLELAIDMPTRRYLQRPATCAIAMVNAGTATARSVELAAQLPPGMKFVRANHAGWHDARTNRVLWNLEELPPGETGTVELVVMPVDLGAQKVIAAARSIDGPSDQVTHVCEVEGVAALFFEVTDSEDPIEIDGVTEYVVRVGNHGTKAATDVRLAATLLGNLEPVDAKGPAGHRIENLGIFFEPLASLAPAEEAVFRVRVRGRAAGNQRVQVQLMSADQSAPITKEEITRVYDDR